MITVLIADDQTMFGSALASLIDEEEDLEIVCVCRDGQEALDSIVTYIPNVALLDIEMPKLNGLDVLDEVQKQGINLSLIHI